jgi:hypothetical protein
MGPGLISLFLTAGATTWIYTKLQQRSGNNTRQSVIAAAVAAAFIFVVCFSILTLIF